MLGIRTIQTSNPDLYRILAEFNEQAQQGGGVSVVVSQILDDVRSRGDDAVVDLTKKFDGWEATPCNLRVPEEEILAAVSSLSSKELDCIKEAIHCVEEFHKQGLPRSWMGTNPHGAQVGERWYPIQRVGVYIPAGNVPLVSTVVMTVTLARLAGVPEIAVFTPAGKSGQVSQQMLACLNLCGVREVYRIGGAQAVGAMAFGTQSIPAVCKVMGPGNAYVAEAQRQVFGCVGVDLLPGPSEALAYADAAARADYLAADLLAQAEHGSGREKIYLVSCFPEVFEKVKEAIATQLPKLKHADVIRKVLDHCTLFIHAENEHTAIEVINFIAPEHFELHVDSDAIESVIEQVHTAGAILCGHETPTVLGDFTAGPSHTLPTSRTGRFFSGLKITDFMRRSSIVRYDRTSLEKARPVVEVFSRLEDLDAHGQSMEIRFKNS